MKQIDTKQWKEFIIKDLFTVKRPSARSQANYNDGDVPFVASGNFNNGVLKYLEPKKDEVLDAGNCITVSPIDGSSFYQEDDFLGRGGAGSSIILLYNPNLNLYNGYFIATVIRTVCRKYAYSDMANKDTIGAEKIKLPVDETGNPDFSYMETYMKNLELAVSSSLTALQSAKKYSVLGKFNLNNWKSFRVIDLFTVKNTHSILKSEIIEDSGKTPYITASNENNGVYSYVEYYDHLKEEGNCIMIGGKTLTITYQKSDFFSNDSHNLALYLKDNIYRTEEIQLFMITALRASIGHSYSWGDSISFKSIQKDCVNLPADSVGNPNYRYMESYITDKLNQTKKALNELALCV
ncbi:MAG: hypothetical protein E7552_05280 [Ruminococcaceae bacterium]|nr:hypothetical protein [Oscillospiraceae bacterium]